MRLEPVFPNSGDPGFNHDAAADAYAWAMEHPEEAVTVAKSLGFEDFCTLVRKNHEPIQDMIDDFVFDRAEAIKKSLRRRVISKAMGGGEVDELVAAGEEISKAFKRDENSLRRQAERQWRGPGGQFRTMNIKIARTDEAAAYTKSKLPSSAARRLGIPKTGGQLDAEKKAKFHNAWLQVADALTAVKGLEPGDVTVAYKFVDDKGAPKGIDIAAGADPGRMDMMRFARGEELDEVEIAVDPSLSAAGAGFDLMAGVVGPQAAGRTQQQIKGFGEGLTGDDGFMRRWNGGIEQEQGTRGDDYRRIGAASRLVQSTFGDQIGPAGRVATALGNWVGTHGPEAEQVLGPGTRKLSYRYRGVEKRPDPDLQQDVDRTMASVTADLAKEGAKPEAARNAARDFLIYGSKSNYAQMDYRAMRRRSPEEIKESPLVTRMAGLLPSMELTQLQLASGHVPPSHGIIIDRRGVITTQAVGYGDDWYLPFNLRTVSQVNGGEYVRTRTLGGLTSEDIYTSLVTEARGVTVVSHSGVFTMEFDKTFRGTRRFNDKSKRMVDRYEKLLDAVKSQSVTPLIPQDRMAELRQKVIDDGYSSVEDQRTALDRLIEKEKQSPSMSQTAIDAQRDEWLNNFYGPTFTEPTGAGLDMEGLKQYYVKKRVVDLAKEDSKPAPSQEFDWDAAAADLAADERAGSSLGGAADALARNDDVTPVMGQNMTTGQKYKLAAAAVKEGRSRDQLESIAAAEFDQDPIEALGRYDSKIGERWDRALTGMKYTYARDNAAMRLDAQGYFNAMKALQEQFPYYIKRVEYRPLPGQEPYTGVTDSGYVMPRYNLPTKAKAGYFDRRITGKKKMSAAETGYQNYKVRQQLGSQGKDENESIESQGGLGGGSLKERKKKLKEINAKTKAGWDLYQHITAPGRHYIYHPGLEGGKQVVNIAQDPDVFKENFSAIGLTVPVMFGDLAGMAQQIDGYKGPTSRAQLAANDGKDRTGPLTKEEFDELAEKVPGFINLVADAGSAVKAKFAVEANADVPSVRSDLIDLVRNGPGGGNDVEVWQGEGVVPDNALAHPNRVFGFPGDAYDPNRPVRIYEEEADSVYGRVKSRARAGGYRMDSWPQREPLRYVSKEQLDTLINTVTDTVDQGDVEEKASLLRDLHKLRRLQRLWGAERKGEAVGDALDEGLRALTSEAERNKENK